MEGEGEGGRGWERGAETYPWGKRSSGGAQACWVGSGKAHCAGLSSYWTGSWSPSGYTAWFWKLLKPSLAVPWAVTLTRPSAYKMGLIAAIWVKLHLVRWLCQAWPAPQAP